MTDSGRNRTEVTRTYDWANVSPSVAIIETIAAFEGETLNRAVEDHEPLEWFVDVDALEAIVGVAPDLALSFAFSGYQIQIDGNDVGVSLAGTGSP